MGSEKRNFVRIPVPMDIEVTRDGARVVVLEGIDICNGGATTEGIGVGFLKVLA